MPPSPQNDRSFYESLPSHVGSLESLLTDQLDSFQDLPGSWHIVVADIQGSTKAVMSGRYEDVNTIADSCVIACLNIARREKKTISALSTLQTNM